MNQNLVDYIKNAMIKKGFKSTTENDILEFLNYDLEPAQTKNHSSHRWWNDVSKVVKVGDKYIGFMWAETTGDDTIHDKGWEFDWNSIDEYEPVELVQTVYIHKT